MTADDREKILDLVWRAMSVAAGGEDVPMEAQIIADVELAAFLDLLVTENDES